jgi:hypothetical protein
MTRKELTRKANRAINAAYKGGALADSIESAYGVSLSTQIDHLWAVSDDHGNGELSRRLERAYSHLTS